MAKTEARGIFGPPPSRQDSKANTTTSVARAILDTEVREREAKTARLREMRLKKEAAEAASAPPPAAKPAKKRGAKAKA